MSLINAWIKKAKKDLISDFGDLPEEPGILLKGFMETVWASSREGCWTEMTLIIT